VRTRFPSHVPVRPRIRYTNSKFRPDILFTDDGNTSFLQLDKLLGDGESQASATVLARYAGISLAKALKDRVQFFLWNTYSRIGYFNFDPDYIFLNAFA